MHDLSWKEFWMEASSAPPDFSFIQYPFIFQYASMHDLSFKEFWMDASSAPPEFSFIQYPFINQYQGLGVCAKECILRFRSAESYIKGGSSPPSPF